MLKRNILLGHDAGSMLSRHTQYHRSVFIVSCDNFVGISLEELLHFFFQYREQFELFKSIAMTLRLKISRDRFYISPTFSIFEQSKKVECIR